MPGMVGTPASCATRFASRLVAHLADRIRAAGQPNLSPASPTACREVSILGEKAVAGMHGVRAAQPRGLDEALAMLR